VETVAPLIASGPVRMAFRPADGELAQKQNPGENSS
jgi:hypothetical protein